MRLKVSILFLFFMVTNFLSFSNCYLILRKGHKKIATFFEKAEIMYFSQGKWNYGVIDSIGDGFIIVKDEKTLLNDIQYLKIIKKSFNFRGNGMMLIIGGIYFVTVETINRLINKDEFDISGNTVLMSTMFLITGAVLVFISTKKYRLGTKFNLDTICF